MTLLRVDMLILGVGEEQPLTSTIPSTITDEGRTIQITTLLNVVLNNSTEGMISYKFHRTHINTH